MSSNSQQKFFKYVNQLKSFAVQNDCAKVTKILKKIEKLDLSAGMVKATSLVETLKPLASKSNPESGKRVVRFVSRWKRQVDEYVCEPPSDDPSDEPLPLPPPSPPPSLPQARQPSTRQPSVNPESKKPDTTKRKSDVTGDHKPPKQAKRSSTGDAKPPPKTPVKEVTGLSFMEALNCRPASKSKSTAVLFSSEADPPRQNPVSGRSGTGETNPGISEEAFRAMETFLEMAELAGHRVPRADELEVEKDPFYRDLAVKAARKELGNDVTDDEFELIRRYRGLLRQCINDVECVGSIPHVIVKPVLQGLCPYQLAKFEGFNPSLAKENHALWKKHVRDLFPGQQTDNPAEWKEIWTKMTKEIKKRDTVKKPEERPTIAPYNPDLKKNGRKVQRQAGTSKTFDGKAPTKLGNMTFKSNTSRWR